MIRELITKHFPAYGLTDTSSVWAQIQNDFRCDQVVSGTIVARLPFGLVVDIGAALPAILLVTRIPGLTPETYDSSPQYSLQAMVEARIEAFAMGMNEIGLTILK